MTVAASATTLSVDIGTRYTKVCSGTGKVLVPSLIGAPSPSPTPTETGSGIRVPQPTLVSADGGSPYCHGQAAQRHAIPTTTYGPRDTELFYRNMSLAVAGEQPGDGFSLVLGLPLWRRDTHELERSIEGRHSVVYQRNGAKNARSFEIENVITMPSVVGAFLSRPRDGLVGIIDVGFSETTLALFRDEELDGSLSGVVTPSLRRTLAAVCKTEAFSDAVVLQEFGSPSREAKCRLEKFAADVMRYAVSRWRALALDALYLTGGGAAFMAGLFSDERTVTLDDPLFASARGLHCLVE